MRARAYWAVGLALAAVLLPLPLAAGGTTERILPGSEGWLAGISANGRFVVFQSSVSTLVPNNTNGVTDVFVYDRQEGTTERVSVAHDGAQADDTSSLGDFGSISGDGRFVAFRSEATNLIPGGTDGTRLAYVRDRGVPGDETKPPRTILVSVPPVGEPSHYNNKVLNAGISRDGRFASFDAGDSFTYELATDKVVCVSVDANRALPDQGSGATALSTTGRFVAFQSGATDLVPGDTNNLGDIFVHDRDFDANGIFDEYDQGDVLKTRTVRVSVATDGSQLFDKWAIRASISGDGRFVTFETQSTDLVPEEKITGRWGGDTDVFIRDRDADEDGIFDEPGGVTTKRMSSLPDGSSAPGGSYYARVCADGSFATFASTVSNWAPSDTGGVGRQAYLYHVATGTVSRASVASDGTPANGDCYTPRLSADGRYVVFTSIATNLVPNDTNGVRDIFIHDRVGSQTTGSIAGTVTDGLGAPLVGASVTASTGQSATTGLGGSYTISGVPTGNRTVTASADGYVAETQAVAVTDGGTATADFALEVAPVATVVSVDEVIYTPSGPKAKDLSITIKLLDDLGNPVVGAEVSISIEVDGSSFANPTGTTGDDSSVSFYFKNIPPGTYTTTVTAVDAAGLLFDDETPTNSYTK